MTRLSVDKRILFMGTFGQPIATRMVWVTMLAMADENGLIDAVPKAIAALAGVELDEAEAAIGWLLQPDARSIHGGAGNRIQETPRGWRVTELSDIQVWRERESTRREATFLKRRSRGQDCVYLIRREGSHCYKVGKSNNPASRLSSLQTGSPDTLELIRVTPGGLGLEKRVHSELAEFAIRGEWFDGPEVPRLFDAAVAMYGEGVH